jgi:hypothetical protein
LKISENTDILELKREKCFVRNLSVIDVIGICLHGNVLVGKRTSFVSYLLYNTNKVTVLPCIPTFQEMGKDKQIFEEIQNLIDMSRLKIIQPTRTR